MPSPSWVKVKAGDIFSSPAFCIAMSPSPPFIPPNLLLKIFPFLNAHRLQTPEGMLFVCGYDPWNHWMVSLTMLAGTSWPPLNWTYVTL